MPSRAYTSFLLRAVVFAWEYPCVSVNALSGLYLISTEEVDYADICNTFGVNALSGLYLISTQKR